MPPRQVNRWPTRPSWGGGFLAIAEDHTGEMRLPGGQNGVATRRAPDYSNAGFPTAGVVQW